LVDSVVVTIFGFFEQPFSWNH